METFFFFFSWTVKVFSWKRGHMQVNRVKKHMANHKLIPVASNDSLRSYEAKQSVCSRNWTQFTPLSPVIHSLGKRPRARSQQSTARTSCRIMTYAREQTHTWADAVFVYKREGGRACCIVPQNCTYLCLLDAETYICVISIRRNEFS